MIAMSNFSMKHPAISSRTAESSYDPNSINAMFGSICAKLESFEERLDKALSWQSSFGIRTEKEIQDIRTTQRVSKGQVAALLTALSMVSAFLAWAGVMAVTVWYKR